MGGGGGNSLFGIQGYSSLKAWVKVLETKNRGVGGGGWGEIWGYNNNRIWDVQLKKYCSKELKYVRKVTSIKFFLEVKKTLFKLTKHSYPSFPPPCHISSFKCKILLTQLKVHLSAKWDALPKVILSITFYLDFSHSFWI